MYRAKIDVTLKKSVLDPQGKTVLSALKSFGFSEPTDMRVGKFFDITLDVQNSEAAEKSVHAMCEKLLVNSVIEEYSFTVEEI
mgnify:CR=1 FL=1